MRKFMSADPGEDSGSGIQETTPTTPTPENEPQTEASAGAPEATPEDAPKEEATAE